MFTNEQTWLQSTVWLLIDLIKFTSCNEIGSCLDSNQNKNLRSNSRQLDASMEVDVQEGLREESKSQERHLDKEPLPSQTEELALSNSLNQASFGETLEWSSSFQKDSRFYKVSL
jgi:hypothetical protein